MSDSIRQGRQHGSPLDREMMVVAMSRALNRPRPTPLDNALARLNAYSRAALIGWGPEDDREAIGRARIWRTRVAQFLMNSN